MRIFQKYRICSIESAIKAYVQKYAKAKKIRDFVKPLEEQLHQVEKETEAKIAALSGGEEAIEIQHRSQAICNMIQQASEPVRSNNEGVRRVSEPVRPTGYNSKGVPPKKGNGMNLNGSNSSRHSSGYCGNLPDKKIKRHKSLIGSSHTVKKLIVNAHIIERVENKTNIHIVSESVLFVEK